MKPSRLQGKRRILVGLTLAIVVSGVWLWWSRRVTEPLSRQAPDGPAPFVQLAGTRTTAADRLLQERAEFFDPAPLFIPTARNYYGGRGLPAALIKQPGQVFGEFVAKYQFGEGVLATYGAEATAVPESVPEVLNRANEAPFAGMGEQGGGPAPLSDRLACMEFKRLMDGELSLAEAPVTPPPRRDFAPLEFLVLVSAAGLVGDPVLTAGSGRPEVDAFFQDYLAKTHRVGERLPPGSYRVQIGP
jgi:hypothetical protein